MLTYIQEVIMRKAFNRVEMEGRTYGSWKVISYSHTKKKKTYYNCICTKCDNEYEVQGPNLRQGLTTQCIPCGRLERNKKLKGHMVSEETRKKISKANTGKVRSEEAKAKSRGFKPKQCCQEMYKLDPTPNQGSLKGLRLSKRVNEFRQHAAARGKEVKLTKLEIAELVMSNCYYCNTRPKPYIGIDRVDSSKGYLRDNVVPCCRKCNTAKLDHTLEDFKAWIKKIAENIDNF